MNLSDSYKKLLSELREEHYELSDEEDGKELLVSIDSLQKQLGFTFPESYIAFLGAIGPGAFENGLFEIYLYDYQDLILFNIGEDRFPELEDYIVFAQDGGSYLYIFDKKNKLQKGNEAVFRVSMTALDDDYIIYLAKDFFHLFELFVHEKKLNETWLIDEK